MAKLGMSLFSNHITPPLLSSLPTFKYSFSSTPLKSNPNKLHCTHSKTPIPTLRASSSLEPNIQQNDEQSTPFPPSSSNTGLPPPLLKKRKRYRKEYPGEGKGITEEMRFVAMKLRSHHKGKGFENSNDEGFDDGVGGDDVWEPSIEGFLKYLVDSKLVFDTIEHVVEDSNDVSYAYFRRTGLERSGSLARDLEWFSQQGMTIPEPSNPGVSYASYLKELAEKSGPLFLSHFYNVYFSHIAGGQVIAKQAAEKLLKERQLEFFNWNGNEQEFLKEVREKLNRLGEHWSRSDKNKCLREATKSFKYLGQIVRLIIIV